jgi:hypothetical protein
VQTVRKSLAQAATIRTARVVGITKLKLSSVVYVKPGSILQNTGAVNSVLIYYALIMELVVTESLAVI